MTARAVCETPAVCAIPAVATAGAQLMSSPLINSEYRRLNVPRAVEKRLGITADEYRAKQDAGEKWCTGCKGWHEIAAFGVSIDQPDGLQTACKIRMKAKTRAYRERLKTGYCTQCEHCRKVRIPPPPC